jgi:hypothetical protein
VRKPRLLTRLYFHATLLFLLLATALFVVSLL